MCHQSQCSVTELLKLIRPTFYYVIQDQQKKAVLALDLSREANISNQVPLLTYTSFRNVFPTQVVKPFNSYQILTYTVTKLDVVRQSIQYYHLTDVRN